MDFAHPVNPNDRGLGPMTIALTWVFTSLAIIVVGLRMYLRKKFHNRWYIDDWIMVLALAFQVIYSGLVTKACDEGMGMTFENMTFQQFLGAEKWSYIAEPFSNLVSVTARISITILLVKIFGSSKPIFKWFLIVYTGLVFVFGVLGDVLAIVTVLPIPANWDPRITPTHSLNPQIEQNISETLQCEIDFLLCIVNVG